MSFHAASTILVSYMQHSRAGIICYQSSNEFAIATSADIPLKNKRDSKQIAR